MKFNFPSKWIPTCFWMEHLLTGTLLKITGWWASLWLLRENTTSWACFETSGLKEIFHWYAYFDILNKSLFNWTTDTLTLSLTEVLLLQKYPYYSDLYRKERGSQMKPWGTPAQTGTHKEDCPFKTIYWNLLLKKLTMNFKELHVMPIRWFL